MNLATGSGTARHKLEDRGLDVYETPPVATRALIQHMDHSPMTIWEPACGNGAIAKVFEEAGHTVIGTDITPDRTYGLGGSIDFLKTQAPLAPIIVTNPPFRYAADFVRHALELRVEHIYMLLRLAFLESDRRSDIIDGGHLKEVFLFRKRLPFMHRDGWNGPKQSHSGMPFAWFHWTGRLSGWPTKLWRIDW